VIPLPRAIDAQALPALVALFDGLADGETCAGRPARAEEPRWRRPKRLHRRRCLRSAQARTSQNLTPLSPRPPPAQPPSDEWVSTFDAVPEPDHADLLAQFERDFSVQRLVLKVKAAA
jgi:hypothetical protein